MRALLTGVLLPLFLLRWTDANADTIKQYYGETVLKIELRGLQRIDEVNAAKTIKQKEGEELDPAQVTEDIKALFALGVFDDVKASVILREGGVTLVYRLKERPVINAVRIQGNDELSEEDINKVINIRAGAMLDLAKVENVAGKIKDLYDDEGYFLAEVDYRIEKLPENSVDVVFMAREYAKVEIKNISFVGNRNVPD
ncbi:MAG: outer membrane protein assembly factor BamA, partial [Deltaproteobacteria bacterium]|nr:outer membrane protein assembly factor BamA [Deltaproteobacteria bacterium]